MKSRAEGFPRLIAFFGPDGAGKTTQVKLLVDFLASNDFRVKQAWVRSVHLFAFVLWGVFRKLNLVHKRSNLRFRGISKGAISYLREESYGFVSPISMNPPILKSSFDKLLWTTVEVMSIVPILLLQVYIPLLRGYYVVAERYVVDSVASIAYFLNDPNFIHSRLARLLLSFIPKGAVFVYVDADYKTILDRRGKESGPYEYTVFHRKLYKELSPLVKAKYVNTCTSDSLSTHQEILELISFSRQQL